MFRLLLSLLLAVSLATAPGIASTPVDCAMGEMPVMASQDMADHTADKNDEMESCSLQCDFACGASAFLVRDDKKPASFVLLPSPRPVPQDRFKSADSDGIDPPPRA